MNKATDAQRGFVSRNRGKIACLARVAYRRRGRGLVVLASETADVYYANAPRTLAYLSGEALSSLGEKAVVTLAEYDPQRQFVCCVLPEAEQDGQAGVEAVILGSSEGLDVEGLEERYPELAALAEQLTP